MKEVRQLNWDGAQLFYLSLWDPPPNPDNLFAGVSEGMDYGEVDRSVEWWKEEG